MVHTTWGQSKIFQIEESYHNVRVCILKIQLEKRTEIIHPGYVI